MRKLLLATTAALGIAASGGVAHATLFYTIWNGTGLSHTASFPVPTTGLFATFTSTSPIDFTDASPEGSPNTFANFFNGSPTPNPSPLVSTPALTAAQLATPMSTLDTGSDISTFIRITETYDLASPLTGSIAHDDGGAIYLDGSTTELCGNPAESNENTESCTFPAGLHSLTLLYTEDNGAPAILVATIPPEVPEPATLAILGTGLLGFGVARRLRKGA